VADLLDIKRNRHFPVQERTHFVLSGAKMSPIFTLTTERARMRVYLIVLAVLIAIALIYKLTHVPTATSNIAAIRPFFLT
jgi:hypothetical protein